MGFHSLLWFIVVAATLLLVNAPNLFASALALAVLPPANGPVNTTFAAVAITVPECAVIVKLVNSTRHEFQIVPVKCPAPEDYWLSSPQMVYFESSDLIEVTRQKDVVIGSLVKFVVPSEAEVRRFTRGVRGRAVSGRQPTGYSQFNMLLVGLRSLYESSSRLWRESIYGIDPPSVEDEYDEYVVQLKKGPELPRLRDETIEHWAALAAKDLGEAKAPDAYENYQRMDDYTWESVQVPMF
jgi:hypothetical protein